MPSRMDGSKPPDWTGLPPDPIEQGIPEVEILNDSEPESELNFINLPGFQHEENEQERLWNLRNNLENRIVRNERRNYRRSTNLNVIISRIEQLWDAGDDAEFHNRENYDWDEHNANLAWLDQERQRLEDAIVRSERVVRDAEREIQASWRPPPRRRRPQNLTNNFNVTNFERF